MGVLTLAGTLGIWCSTGTAQAAVSTFSMSPSAGPPGTVVHVSGTGCTPGLLPSDFDFVTVSATRLHVVLWVPVASNGSWQGSFTVPARRSAGPALVDAVCVSSGVQSLLTVYAPQLFTVTAATPPTTPPGDTTPGPAPHPPGDGSGNPTPTKAPAGSTPTSPGTPAPGSVTIGGADSATSAVGAGPASGGSAVSTGDTRARAAVGAQHARGAGPATLQPAELGTLVSPVSGAGLGWVSRLLLIALVIAAIGAPAWLRRSRRSRPTTEPVREAT